MADTMRSASGSVVAIGCFKAAARLGNQESLDKVMKVYRAMKMSKNDIDEVIRAFQESTNATKSKDRDEANAFVKMDTIQMKQYIQSFRARVRKI